MFVFKRCPLEICGKQSVCLYSILLIEMHCACPWALTIVSIHFLPLETFAKLIILKGLKPYKSSLVCYHLLIGEWLKCVTCVISYRANNTAHIKTCVVALAVVKKSLHLQFAAIISKHSGMQQLKTAYHTNGTLCVWHFSPADTGLLWEEAAHFSEPLLKPSGVECLIIKHSFCFQYSFQ